MPEINQQYLHHSFHSFPTHTDVSTLQPHVPRLIATSIANVIRLYIQLDASESCFIHTPWVTGSIFISEVIGVAWPDCKPETTLLDPNANNPISLL